MKMNDLNLATDEFITIEENSEGKYSEKRSKFLSFAFNVASEKDCDKLIQEMKKKYYKANHIVWAYKLENGNQKFTDDREPNNSAGPPILNAINKFQIENIIVFVMRYFGGIKLGVGGLINAYYSAAYEAIFNAKKITIIKETEVNIPTNFQKMSSVINKIKQLNGKVIDIKYSNNVDILAKIRNRDKDKLLALQDYYKQ